MPRKYIKVHVNDRLVRCYGTDSMDFHIALEELEFILMNKFNPSEFVVVKTTGFEENAVKAMQKSFTTTYHWETPIEQVKREWHFLDMLKPGDKVSIKGYKATSKLLGAKRTPRFELNCTI